MARLLTKAEGYVLNKALGKKYVKRTSNVQQNHKVDAQDNQFSGDPQRQQLLT